MITLGLPVKDRVSGFKGIATGRSTYLSGSAHICITPKVGKDGKKQEGHWFDEPMVDVVGKKKVKGGPRNIGGPMLSPLPPSR